MFSVLTRCLGFIYKIYLTQIMTTTELGVYNISTSIYMVLITIVGSSIPLTISKITSANKSMNRNEFTNYSVTSSLILTTSISIVLSILVLFCKPLLILIIGSELGYQIILYLIPSIIFTAIYSQLRGYLWGVENYFAVSIVEFIEQILRMVFCFLFVMLGVFESPALAVSLALSIACALSTICGIVFYYKNGGKFRYQKGYYKDIIKSSLPLTAVRVFGSLLQPLITLLIPVQLVKLGISQEMALSEIGIVTGMTMPLLSIPSTIIGALCMILIPRISSSNNNNEQGNQINNYLKFTISCIFIFIPVFIAIGPDICGFVFNNTTSGLYLSYSSWIMLPLGITQLTTSILNALNQEQKTFIYYIISNLFLILMIFILPKFFGIKAMLYGMGLSAIIQAILNIRKIKKLTNIKLNVLSPCFTQILISFPVILITKFSYNILLKFCNTFFALFISCFLGILSFISLLFVFNVLEFKSIKDNILKFTNKKTNKAK